MANKIFNFFCWTKIEFTKIKESHFLSKNRMATLTTQIFVGDLPKDIDEIFLRHFFAESGEIIPNSGIVLKKHKTLDSSFAFVTFATHEQAAEAMKNLNYTKLDGRPIRILWCDTETKAIIKSGRGSLFINGLDESIEVSQLHDAFSTFGEIISCKIPLTDGKSRGYGYIQFRNPENAEKAKLELADASINGKPIKIDNYNRKSRRNPDEDFTNVYIKPLPVDQVKTDEDLRKIFEPFGEIQNPSLKKDENGNSKGFGFCNFKLHEDAVKAVEGLNGQEMFGVTLQVNRLMSKREKELYNIKKHTEKVEKFAEETNGRNLYVKSFSKDVTDEEFQEYFSKFGEIELFKIERVPETKESKGFGFVLYKSKEDAQNAIEMAMLERLHGDLPYVGFFQTKAAHERVKVKNTHPRPSAVPAIAGNLMENSMTTIARQYQPVEDNSPKGQLKQLLQEKGVLGTNLKRLLSSVSAEQAVNLVKEQSKFEIWYSHNAN